MNNSLPTVSIVVPTYNEADIIESRLRNLLQLDYPDEKLEIIVVDSGDDDTISRAQTVFTDIDAPTLTVVSQSERRGVASAVNEGVERASNEVVFRTDADSYLAPDCLKAAVESLSKDGVGAVTGRQTEVIGGSRVEADYRDGLAKYQSVESAIDSTFICHGPCFAFKKKFFDPIPEDTIADDTEVGIRIRRQGQKVKMNPEMEFSESGASRFKERRKRKDRRAAGLVQVLFRNRDMLGRFGLYGSVVLPLNWLLLIAAPLFSLLAFLVLFVAGVVFIGLGGLLLPALLGVVVWLGGRERLGPLQPLYSVVDVQMSLISGIYEVVLGDSSGIWEIDRESRKKFG